MKYRLCQKRINGWHFEKLLNCQWDRKKSGGLKDFKLYDDNLMMIMMAKKKSKKEVED